MSLRVPGFPASLTEAGSLAFAFTPEWTTLNPSFIDPKYHRVTVSGAGFDKTQAYSCVFTGVSTEPSQNASNLAWTSTAAVSLSGLDLACAAPEWTLFPPSEAPSLPAGTWVYTDTSDKQPVVVTVLRDGSPMLKPEGGAAAELVLVHINRRPDFKLAYSEVHWDENGGLRTIKVASGMLAGVTNDGTHVPSEDLQQYSFKVESDLQDIFKWSKRPYISSQGDLSFEPDTDRNGIATLKARGQGNLIFEPDTHCNGVVSLTITLADDGGNLHGGFSVSEVRTLYVVIDARGQAPKFDADRTLITVATLPFFVTNVAQHDAYEQLALLEIE
ncbi:hypothetical protein T484DRAFT_1810940, partial [Baffinella frigidus]